MTSFRPAKAALLAVAAVAGSGTMIVELAAVRLLAPWFGTSLVVWTNVIAVVLLALSLGYLIGGRLSGSGRPLFFLGVLLCLAAAATAWLPALSAPLARFFLPEGVRLDEAASLVLWGSLAVSLGLFLPPALLLGAVTPLAVEAVQGYEHGTAGHAGGEVLCASTLGSLVGVFGTSHVLLPRLGLSVTFFVAAGLLLAAGVAALSLGGRGRAPAGLALVVAAAAIGLGQRGRPSLPEGVHEIAAAESSYQSIRIVSDETYDRPLRFLQVNEGFDSFQSAWQEEPGLLPPGFYYNDFVLPPLWAGVREEWRVLVLGLGAGSAVRVISGTLPADVRMETVGVEIDPMVVELARRHMDLSGADQGLEVLADMDARVALRSLASAGHEFDQIVLDCYANQVEMPPHLCTVEFFREVRERLAPGGWVTANLGGFGFDDPVVAAVARTCATAFEADVLLLRVPQSRNYTLLARRGAELPLDAEGRLRAPDLAAAPQGSAALDRALRELVASRMLPGSVQRIGPEHPGLLLTDERAPLERLQQRSLREGRARLFGEEEP